MMRAVFRACLLVSVLRAAPSAAAGAGTSGASLLNVNVGARNMALGCASVALSGDLSSVIANPALVSPIAARSIVFMHWPGIAEINTEFVSYSMPLGWVGTWAGTVLFRSMPDIDNDVEGESPVAVNEGMIMMSLGRPFDRGLGHAGLSVKLFNSTLGEVKATSVALDLGAVRSTGGRDPLLWGLSLVNLGNPIKHEIVGEPLPLAIRGGASYVRSFYPHALTAAGEVSVNLEEELRVSAGVEWLQAGRLALRGGCAWRRYAPLSFSLGTGWQMRSTALGPEAEYHFDYAFVPFAFLEGYEPTHAFSVFIKF